MIRVRHSRFLLVIAATVGLAAAAWGEGIFPVNDAGTGVFDQASVAAYGTVLHVAFVGGGSAGGPFRLYYAAVNGGTDFTNEATTRAQVLRTAPVAIDNGSLYTDARHPQAALRSATELVILFQAIPSGDTDFKLFRALLTIDNNAVTTQRVDEIVDPLAGRMPGKLVDPSFAVVVSDNSLRVAYTDIATGTGNVSYARVGTDNAFLVGSPILLSSRPETQGIRPLPRLRLDGYKNSHVVWAANNNDATRTPSGVYYAMVHAVSPTFVDNLAIGATQVLWGGYRWGFPNVLLTTPNKVWILAADEPPSGSAGLAGSLGISEINPYAVTRDGNPVNVNNVPSNASFFLNPPGGSVLSSNFNAYQPESSMDSSLRVHVAGYGFRGGAPLYQGTPGRFYSMALGTTTSNVGTSSLFATMAASPVSVGIGDTSFAMQIPGDYSRPAFAHFNGKAVHFWSGPDNVVAGARNLYVTSTTDSPDNSPKQSGCSMVDDPRRGEAGRVPGAAVLLLPAIFLALRRAARKAFAAR